MNDTLQMFGIQWPKFIIQLINFTVLLLILKKFAYPPIFKMLDQRKAKIAESVANADQIKAQLAKTEVDRQKTLPEAGELANKIIADARAAAVRVSEVETQKAIAAAELIVTRAREAAAQERAALLAELKHEVGRLVVQTTAAVSGKVLTLDDQRRLAEETQRQIAA